MGTAWNGLEERPLEGVRRLRETFAALLGLTLVAVVGGAVTVLLSGRLFLFTVAWLPLVAYLFLCTVWADALPGFVVWRDFVVDRAWARFWLDDGNLETELEYRMRGGGFPFLKECRWSYVTHYHLPEGLHLGVVRLSVDRWTERVLLLVEGVNEMNLDVAEDIISVLGDVDIHQVPVRGNLVLSSTPWGYTARA